MAQPWVGQLATDKSKAYRFYAGAVDNFDRYEKTTLEMFSEL